jgi:pimeloyl-ACP methyl ester carboxylesterase
LTGPGPGFKIVDEAVGALDEGEVLHMVPRDAVRWSLGLSLALSLAAAPLRAADKGEDVSFDTVDGVTLTGKYYKSSKGKEAPIVLLLHDFKYDKGGNSHVDGWDDLAVGLQEKGCAVLSFDFRGHGNSTKVDPKVFLSPLFPHNKPGNFRTPVKMTDTSFTYKQFGRSYYPYMVNDILAARAYLDQHNDDGDFNCQKLIVIGAGEGAALGMMWLDSEWKRVSMVSDPLRPLIPPRYGKPEGGDIACAIWLTISPSVAEHSLPMGSGDANWMKTVGKTNKTPIAFIYGKKDAKAAERSLAYLKVINPKYERDKKPVKTDPDLQFTGEYAVPDTSLIGSQLLDKSSLGTQDWIIKEYLEPLLEKRTKPWDSRDFKRTTYVYLAGTRVLTPPCKAADTKAFNPLPFNLVGVATP